MKTNVKTFVKTLTAMLGLAFFAAGAAAEDRNFTVTFPYDAAAGIEANRAVFEDVARRVCRKEWKGYVGVAQAQVIRACKADLVTKAVAVAMKFEDGARLAKND